MPEVPVSVALEMKRLLHEIWQEFLEHQPACPRCGAPWAEYGWDHESDYGERISARCENFHEFVIDFDDDFIIEEGEGAMTIQQASQMLNEVEAQLGEEFTCQYYFTLRTEDDDQSGARRVVEVLLRDAGNSFLVATFPIDEATTAEELADAIRSWLKQKGVRAHES